MAKIDWKAIQNEATSGARVTAKMTETETIVTICADGNVRRVVEQTTVEKAYKRYFEGQKEIFGREPWDLTSGRNL